MEGGIFDFGFDFVLPYYKIKDMNNYLHFQRKQALPQTSNDYYLADSIQYISTSQNSDTASSKTYTGHGS